MADLPNPKNRKELYLYDAATGRTGDLPSPKTREELYLNEIAENGGGSGGTDDYEKLKHLPKINNVELRGNKSASDLSIYTKSEVDDIVETITTMNVAVVQTLPTEDISTTTIYLVPKADAETDNVYDEYLYVSNAWELIGSTEIDLTDYVTDTDLTTSLADYTTTANLTTLLANKADASDVDDIEALIPSTATISNKLITLSDVPKGTATDCPIGMTALFDDTTAPSGWLVADGTVYDIDDYPFLANHFERVHGSKNYYGGDGTTTFAVPDWQGEFFRASGTNSHTNQGDGAAVGVHQDGTEHVKVASDNWISYPYDGFHRLNDINADNITQSTGYHPGTAGVADTSTNNFVGLYTSRPTNTSLLCCIKAVPAGINYSLDEQEIGTWVDGKKLYQNTVSTGTAVPSGATEISRITNGQTDYDTIQYTKA